MATKKYNKENKNKSSIILSCIGQQSRETFNTFIFSQEEERFDYNVIVQKFKNFCILR